MSDHISGPRALSDPIADITDVYAFPSPETPGRIVLVVNTLPMARPDARPRLPRVSMSWRCVKCSSAGSNRGNRASLAGSQPRWATPGSTSSPNIATTKIS